MTDIVVRIVVLVGIVGCAILRFMRGSKVGGWIYVAAAVVWGFVVLLDFLLL